MIIIIFLTPNNDYICIYIYIYIYIYVYCYYHYYYYYHAGPCRCTSTCVLAYLTCVYGVSGRCVLASVGYAYMRARVWLLSLANYD